MQGTHLSTSQLRTILEGATGLSGEIHKGGGVISPRGIPCCPQLASSSQKTRCSLSTGPICGLTAEIST